MSNIDRDFAAYLAYVSQRSLEADNPKETDLYLRQPHALLDEYVKKYPDLDVETLSVLRVNEIPKEDVEDLHQIQLYWGSVRNAQPNRDQDVRDRIGIDVDRVLLSIIDDSPDAVCGHSTQFQATITIVLSYRLGTRGAEQLSEGFNRQLAREWASKIESFFSYKRVISDFPPLRVVDAAVMARKASDAAARRAAELLAAAGGLASITAEAAATFADIAVAEAERAEKAAEDAEAAKIAAGITENIETQFDFVRRDSHFVRAYPIPGGGGAIPADGRTYEVMQLTVAGSIVQPA